GPLGSRFELAGSGAAAFHLSWPAGRLVVEPQRASIQANGVVNAASYRPALAPGGLMAIFGSGLARAGAPTEVEMSGIAARVVAATPFQLNVEVPLGLTPGLHALRVRSPFGTVEQQVTVQAVAPAIFSLPTGGAAIVNQDGTINGPSNPVRRGQAVVIYCTGLGEVTQAGPPHWAKEPVRVMVDGRELAPLFAGRTPNFSGLYQVNVLIPSSLPPSLDASLVLRQGTVTSNAVPLAIE
ncbi:MAG: hypothetical protein ACPL88_03455, partial [Bryobacteraceae bacterium]